MGSTKKAITKVYVNNAATASTVAETVESEIVSYPGASGVNVAVEVARQDVINPGIIGGTKHNN